VSREIGRSSGESAEAGRERGHQGRYEDGVPQGGRREGSGKPKAKPRRVAAPAVVGKTLSMESRPTRRMNVPRRLLGRRQEARLPHTCRLGIIAVDPRVIKIGSRVFVAGYGYAVACDVGGAIKGNIIDVCYWAGISALR